MAKSAGQKRRRRENRRARAARERQTRQAPRPRVETWSTGKVMSWTVLGVVAFVALVPAFWYSIAPAISDLVSPVPVLAVIAGWLPAGGALAATGFFMVNHDDLLPRTRVRLAWVLGVWGVLALATMPIDVDSPPLDDEYYAGLEMGFLGALVGAVVVPLGVYVLWKPFHRRKEPTTAVWGCAFTIYAIVLLLLAAAASWLV